jgi:hypothetical protein
MLRLSNSFSQKRGCSGMLGHMSSPLEIEMAPLHLPSRLRWEISCWLLENVQESNASRGTILALSPHAK